MSYYTPVPVWSRLQRVIHWVLAFSVLLLIPLGAFILNSEALHVPDEGVDIITDIHAFIGFIFGGGVLARAVYLVAGAKTSRLNDILPLGKAQREIAWATLRYYLSGFKGKPPLYYAHNPLAGIAYAGFFLFAVTQATSGLILFILYGESSENSHTHDHAHGENIGEGPLEWVEGLHVAGAIVIILFVLAHFVALAVHDIVERRGLASSMIGGRKFFDEEELRELEQTIKEKAPKE